MNWKTLLVIASLSLSAGLTACNKGAAPDATKPAESAAPAAGGDAKPPEAGKPAEAPKVDAKPAEAPKSDAKPEAGAKPGDKKPEAPKKP